MNEHAVSTPARCTSYYLVEPPEWLEQSESTGGKLNCPNCQTRIGNWNWSGIKCSCDAWATPGFQIHCSRVDDNKLAIGKQQSKPAANEDVSEIDVVDDINM